MITAEQIKAARAMLDMSQKQLAQQAGISLATLNNIERAAQLDPKISTMKAIQAALEAERIEFITGSLDGAGVCLMPKRMPLAIATILMVDDSKADRTLYKSWLNSAPGKKYRIVEAENARGGFDIFADTWPDCVILDFMMVGADGLQLLNDLRREQTQLPPIIFVTGMSSKILEERARDRGVLAYLDKTHMSKTDLCGAVERALAA